MSQLRFDLLQPGLLLKGGIWSVYSQAALAQCTGRGAGVIPGQGVSLIRERWVVSGLKVDTPSKDAALLP